MRYRLVLSIIIAGCSAHPESPRVSPSEPQCDFVNYHRDESVNVQGPGQCTTDCDCDGMRSCKDGTCTGEARPNDVSHCNDPSYRWNEAWNGGGSGVCANDCECDGTRNCVAGHCQAGSAAKPGDSAIIR
jgi:hypothetical protein